MHFINNLKIRTAVSHVFLVYVGFLVVILAFLVGVGLASWNDVLRLGDLPYLVVAIIATMVVVFLFVRELILVLLTNRLLVIMRRRFPAVGFQYYVPVTGYSIEIRPKTSSLYYIGVKAGEYRRNFYLDSRGLSVGTERGDLNARSSITVEDARILLSVAAYM